MVTGSRVSGKRPERTAMMASARGARLLACLAALLLGGVATLRAVAEWATRPSPIGILSGADGDRLRVNDLNLARLSQTPEGRRQLESDAREQLASEPLSARALRQLGTVRALADDDADSERLHLLAERVSRRDLGTQLWLIERSAAAGDVAETLRHYDLALTTEPGSGALLYPVLASAISDSAISDALLPYVRADRPWVRAFLAAALGEAPPASLVPLVAAATPETAKGIMGPLLSRMARDKDFVVARTLLMATAVGRAASGTTAVSERTTAPQLGPFGWQLLRSDGVDASRDGEALVARVSSGASGVAARRTFILPPGRYRFGYALESRGVSGGASVGTEAQCLGVAASNARPLPAALERAGDTRKPVAHDLSVPTGCNALAIAFRVVGGDTQQDESLRIDGITLARTAVR